MSSFPWGLPWGWLAPGGSFPAECSVSLEGSQSRQGREGCPTEPGWRAQEITFLSFSLYFALLHCCWGDLLERRMSIFCCPKMKAFQMAGCWAWQLATGS